MPNVFVLFLEINIYNFHCTKSDSSEVNSSFTSGDREAENKGINAILYLNCFFSLFRFVYSMGLFLFSRVVE